MKAETKVPPGAFKVLLVMALIATMIFRLAGFYLGTINEALEMAR